MGAPDARAIRLNPKTDPAIGSALNIQSGLICGQLGNNYNRVWGLGFRVGTPKPLTLNPKP